MSNHTNIANAVGMDNITSPRLDPPEKNIKVGLVECPRPSCLAEPGQPCRTPKGTPTRRSHDQRYGRLHVIYDQYDALLTAIYDNGYSNGRHDGWDLGYMCGESNGRLSVLMDPDHATPKETEQSAD